MIMGVRSCLRGCLRRCPGKSSSDGNVPNLHPTHRSEQCIPDLFQQCRDRAAEDDQRRSTIADTVNCAAAGYPRSVDMTQLFPATFRRMTSADDYLRTNS